jgi:hypothetical protein
MFPHFTEGQQLTTAVGASKMSLLRNLARLTKVSHANAMESVARIDFIREFNGVNSFSELSAIVSNIDEPGFFLFFPRE